MANVTWNSADKNAAITLSGDLITASNASQEYHGVRGTVSYTSGLYYFEADIPTGNEGAAGVANASHTLAGPLGYSNPNGLGIYHDGSVYAGGSSYSTGVTMGGATAGFLVNAATKRLWVRSAAGAWVLGGDPTSSGPGIDLSGISGALFPMFVAYFPTDTSTIRAETTNITKALPAGAALWGDGSGTVTPPPTTTTTVLGSVYWH